MRGKSATRRVTVPDEKFQREDIAKFTNYIMERGKKTIAKGIVYEAMDVISEKTKADAVEIFAGAIKNASPSVEIKSKRVGGANYQVPQAVRPERSYALGCRWLIDAAQAKKGKRMAVKLAEELIAAYNNEGSAIKKKQDVYRMAEANRAFAHFSR